MKKTRQLEIAQNILFYMRQELLNANVPIDNYWINVEYRHEYYIMGVPEPKIQPDSEDVLNINIDCTNEELEKVFSFCVLKGYLSLNGRNSYKITYLGLEFAEGYEEYLEYLKINPVKRFFMELVATLNSKSARIGAIFAFSIGLLLNALINLDKIIENWRTYILPFFS
jgi:hypothetical protein